MQASNAAASPTAQELFGSSNPFELGPDAENDILVLDNSPAEVTKFGEIMAVLGYRTQVLDRLAVIGDNLTALKSRKRKPPKLLAVDLSWDFRNATYALLGREDVKVPREQHMRGMVMLRDVLTHEPVLREVPSVLFSSFLDDYDHDYKQGLASMRKRGIRVDSIAKNQLRGAGGLERVADVMRNVGLDLPSFTDVPYGASLDVTMITDERMDRALEVLAGSLQLDVGPLKEAWRREGQEHALADEALFDLVRLAFKVLLAIKTIFPGQAHQRALDDLGAVLPGVVVRDAVAKAHFRSLHLLGGVLERRVGGPL